MLDVVMNRDWTIISFYKDIEFWILTVLHTIYYYSL